MNALYISYDGVLDPLGPSQITPYVKGLSLRGIKFTLLTFEKKEKLKNIDKVDKLKKELIKKNIKWEILRYHKLPTVPATAFDIITGILKGLVIVLRDNIKVIHARSFIGAIPALLLAKLLNCKFIFDNRGFYPEERTEGDIWKKNGLLYKAAKWFEKLFLINSDYTVCLTWEAKKIIRALPYLENKNIPIEVIPTCVDISNFRIKTKDTSLIKKLGIDDRFIFIYLGSIGTWYMLDEMLNFFRVAKRINPDSFFLFLTPFKDMLREKLERKGIGLNDFHVDFISYEEIPEWISIANAAVSFIKPVYSKKSSCPTKFAEVLACGLPVVINAGIGDTEMYVRKYGIGVVVERFADDEYASAADKLFRIINNGDDFNHRCRKVAEDFFAMDKGIEQYLRIYNSLL